MQRPSNITKIALRHNLEPQRRRSSRTRPRRCRPVPGAGSAVVRDVEDAVRQVAVRAAGVRVGGGDGSADAKQLDALRVGVRAGWRPVRVRWGPAVGECEAADLAAVSGGEGDREERVGFVLDSDLGGLWYGLADVMCYGLRGEVLGRRRRRL